VDSKEPGNASKEKQDNRLNGKGQPKNDGKKVEDLALADDAIISTSNTKSKGRDLVKFVVDATPSNAQTLEESDTHEKFDQFKGKK